MKDQKTSNDLLLRRIEELEKENQRLTSLISVNTKDKLEGFFNIALDLLCIADNDGNFIRVNKSWEKTLGYPSEYLVKHKFLEFVHPDDMQITLEAMKRLREKEQVLNFVNRYRCKDGSWKYIEWRSLTVGELIYAAARDISERIEFENALMASEERFALVIDATELGVWDWNVETDNVYYSPQWKRQVGYEDYELKNDFKTWQDLLHTDDYDRMHKEVSDYLDNPTEYFVAEFRLRHKNGNYVWIHNKASAKKDGNGRVVRFFGAHSDITNRKIAEILLKEKNEQIEAQNEEYKQLNEELYYAKEAIEKSEKKFRNLVESAFDGIYLIEGRSFTYVNPRFTEITEYSYEEITDKEFNFEKLLTQGSKKIVEERYNARKRGETTPSRYEFQILTKNGEIKDVEVSTVQIGKEGDVIIMGIMKDITNRRNMEREIAHRSQLQTILTNLGASFINIQPQNIDREINEALAVMGKFSQVDRAYIFSYNFEKDTMSNTYEWCSDDTKPEIDNLKDLPNSLVPQWVNAHKRGDVIHIPRVNELPDNDNVRAILEEQGVKSAITIPMVYQTECLGFVGFDSVKSEKDWRESEFSLLKLFADLLVNVQVKIRYQQSLKMAKEKAEESDRLKSAFLSNMSHEIRTPMNAICGFSNLLLNRSINDDEKEEFVQMINVNSQQLLSIINDIIDVSKIEAGQVTVANADFALNDLLKDIQLMFRQTVKLKGLELKVTFGLPNEQSKIISDELKIKQVLSNLIYNAIKFTKKGFIDVGYRLTEGFIELYVKDTGIGINSDHFDRIFERFQQVENASTESRTGTGLGLPICKAYIELLGGKIWLTSTLGEGSTFFFTIPFIPSETQVYHIERPENDGYNWVSKNILIAEDDTTNYMYLRELVSPTRATVFRAKNGKEVIDACTSMHFDLILMDMKMPIMDGFEATKILRSKGNQLPIIAQTAYAFSEDKQKAIESGCNDYISKPIRQVELLWLIAKWLDYKMKN